jgi:hypothetical protein
MSQLLFTLLGEGPSDDALIPIIEWVLERPTLGLLPDVEIIHRFVGPDEVTDERGLRERIMVCAADFPSDLLVVHHDADGPTHDLWSQAIRHMVADARRHGTDLPPIVPIVPVRELEAWLLIDEAAIREAVGVPHGLASLTLPHLHEVEACSDPKAVLRQALRDASELPRRRWTRLDAIRPRTIVNCIKDLTLLRQLTAFQAFEDDVRQVIQDQGWPERLG